MFAFHVETHPHRLAQADIPGNRHSVLPGAAHHGNESAGFNHGGVDTRRGSAGLQHNIRPHTASHGQYLGDSVIPVCVNQGGGTQLLRRRETQGGILGAAA